ncbi:hypothetical protein M885DRAFT_535059 [Pelagophyceae sp. CCMP2097]|nr:hypothetical protein M885DRAFT_535059 [Pelagophyceae sp. CCMP2097]
MAPRCAWLLYVLSGARSLAPAPRAERRPRTTALRAAGSIEQARDAVKTMDQRLGSTLETIEKELDDQRRTLEAAERAVDAQLARATDLESEARAARGEAAAAAAQLDAAVRTEAARAAAARAQKFEAAAVVTRAKEAALLVARAESDRLTQLVAVECDAGISAADAATADAAASTLAVAADTAARVARLGADADARVASSRAAVDAVRGASDSQGATWLLTLGLATVAGELLSLNILHVPPMLAPFGALAGVGVVFIYGTGKPAEKAS